MVRYSFEDVAQHLRKEHPGCPEFAVNYFATSISEREWRNASLGMAVGITLQTYLRHNLTEYETLLLTGVDREEALRRVQPRVAAMLKTWKRKKRKKRRSKASNTQARRPADATPSTDECQDTGTLIEQDLRDGLVTSPMDSRHEEDQQ
ncbi:hypothetical protein SAMN05880582_107194 [Rhizobium sp. RU20A]|uniref:DUF2293 domain-containing protein n=1 Tax=Rhizobium sp. RU20A TaxID=1907412 RepID=UPI0009560374|nr:DUF2293 domain-containing protein [Rhizobium sp. RU20A]SIR19333.1 hypothetical protein SAMN05880582_107194 [Rhizobium sp. RU20A]